MQEVFNDLSIFTNKNENGIKLSDRLNTVLTNSKYFDILVGYFRITGFYLLANKLDDVEEIRILIGLGTDQETVKAVDLFQMSGANAVEEIKLKVKEEFNLVDDENVEMENGVIKFCEWISSGKLKIRLCYEKNVHAKLYIVRKNQQLVPDQFGNLITGSSNFSFNGLEKNVEFNVELKNYNDVKYALDFFEELWKTSKDVTQDVVNTIKSDTWMDKSISPYELFLKTIFTYFEEEITDKGNDFDWPDGFMALRYQEDAVIQAQKILAKHGGVLIADVVGLGKTYIAAMLGKRLKGRKLFIVPPVIKENWERVLAEFGYKMSDKVISMGIVDQACEWENIDSYDYVFVDEAHRFRNISSSEFQCVKKICFNKGVILITATPQNNTILDIENLLSLFQDTKNSSIIPNVPNLENYFSELRTELAKAKGTDEYDKVISEVAEDVRNNVLRNVLIRRTRREISTYYKEDLAAQNLAFPTLKDPVPLTYTYDSKMEAAFNQTIELLKKFTYARYAPLLYLKNKSKLGSNKARQENMKGFVKTMLIKRLESSIYAFNESIKRLQSSSQSFIRYYEQTNSIPIGAASRKIDLDELSMMSAEDFELTIEANDIECYSASEFSDGFIQNVKKDDDILNQIYQLWEPFDVSDTDAKYDVLKKKLDELEKLQVIIFTEAKDTVDHLYKRLTRDYGDSVISFSGSDSLVKKQIIQDNFDPQFIKKGISEKRILVTTDALSEGVNLHRASVIINYDLPWNPTRVMQRVGRINRVGSVNDTLYIYNFFPSANTREHLSLEETIKVKIKLFHELLGEDSKLITDDEEVGSYNLYDFLMMANKLPSEEEDGINTIQMGYIHRINLIKKDDPVLYNRVLNLPDKIRVSVNGNKNEMITFIKQGLIKKFLLNDGVSKEIEFENAVKMLECSPDTKAIEMPTDFYNKYNVNKQKFTELINQSIVQSVGSKRDSINEKKAKQYIKFLLKQNLNKDDRKFVDEVDKAVKRGTLNARIFKDVINSIPQSPTMDNILKAFRNNVDERYLVNRKNYDVIDSSKEKEIVVLSEYFSNRR